MFKDKLQNKIQEEKTPNIKEKLKETLKQKLQQCVTYYKQVVQPNDLKRCLTTLLFVSIIIYGLLGLGTIWVMVFGFTSLPTLVLVTIIGVFIGVVLPITYFLCK